MRRYVYVMRWEREHPIWRVVAVLCACGAVACHGQIIEIAQGKLSGSTSRDGSYVSYNGIPYAGYVGTAHRFRKAPLPTSWPGVRNAINEGNSCTTYSEAIEGSDDCLYLNVHVPTTGSKSLPVLVWFHGGGFTSGSASPRLYGPAYLVRHGIILVTVNYRLGPLGFLCLGHEKVPGNAGAKDAVMALRWIRDNIVAFNGNPNQVTIAGQSTGAALTESIMTSQMAHGLFHGAILQSGSVLSPWSFSANAEEKAKLFGSRITGSREIDEIADSLIKTEPSKLRKTSSDFDYVYFPFSLCKENAFRREECFLKEDPKTILQSGDYIKVPMIIGYNSDESYILVQYLGESTLPTRVNSDPSLLIPSDFNMRTEVAKRSLSKRLQSTYFSQKNRTLRGLLDYHNDMLFWSHIYRSIKFHVGTEQPVYVYEFDHVGKYGVAKTDGVRKTGAAHSDELAYLFKAESIDDMPDKDARIRDYITALWANFVRFGNPTPPDSPLPSWEPATTGDYFRVYRIRQDLEMINFQYRDRMQKWEEIFDEYT